MRYPTILLALAGLTAPLRAQPPQYDHIVVVMEENHSAKSILGNYADAPFLNELAARGVSLTNMAAILHPSQPNYLELFSGDTQGVRDDLKPAGLPFTTPNLGAALIEAGMTFAGYSEGLPRIGSQAVSTVRFDGFPIDVYARKHVPWTNWQSNVQPQPANTLPPSVNLPFTSFPRDFSTLPTMAFVIPNEDHDMHNGTDPIPPGDRWLENHIGAYADWAEQNNSLLIVTWDEDDLSEGNRIPTILVGAHLRKGLNAGAWTLHNLLRTLTDLNGLAPIGRTADVSRITGIFEGENPVGTRTFRFGAAYRGVHDTVLDAAAPNAALGTRQAASLAGAHGIPKVEALVRFDDIFGVGPSQVPADASIVSAQLRLTTLNVSGSATKGSVAIHRMRQPWSEASTWNSFGGGVDIDDIEADAVPDFFALPVYQGNIARFDVTKAIGEWVQGATNDGWLVRQRSPDNALIALSEYTARVADRPALEVTFEASEIAFAETRVEVVENAGNATLTVNRTGATNAAAACDFITIDGTARAGRDYVAKQGTLTWDAGDTTSRTIDIAILGDARTERRESFSVKLRAPTGIAVLGAAQRAFVVVTE